MSDEKPEEPQNEEDIAAAWDAMANAPTPEEGSAAAKDLNQAEIDRLLGVAQSEEAKDRGIRAMLDRALMSYERLPMLEVVFDRFARMLSTSLRNMTAENVDVDIKAISSLRFGDYANTIPMPVLLTIFKVVEWENFGMIIPDGMLTYSLVDILFGGRKANRPIKFDGRPFTTIEQGVVRYLSDVLLNDLGSAFEPLSPSTFQFERIETNPRFATIARPADAAILLTLNIAMDERGGKIDILFPYATLEPIRKLLLQVFIGEKFGKDPAWEMHLANEVYNTSVTLEAILDQKTAYMQDIMRLKVGSTIVMNASPEDDIIVNCEGVKMLTGKLGRVGDKIAVSINQVITKKVKEVVQ